MAVLATRRDALRTWFTGGAARTVVMGALAAGLGAQAGATPSVGQTDLKSRSSLSHSLAAQQATGGSAIAAAVAKPSESGGVLKLSESESDSRAGPANLTAAAELATISLTGGQGWRLPDAGAGAGRVVGERIDVLNDAGLFDVSGIAGSNPGSGRGGNTVPGSQPGEAGPASDSSSVGGAASSWSALGSPSDEVAPAAGSVFGWQGGFSAAVLAGYAGQGSGDGGGMSAPGAATRSTLVFAAWGGQAQVGGSAGLAAPSMAVGLPAGLGAPRPGAVPEPATWAVMLLGLGLVGAASRRRRACA
jgi:hypothetical protein